MSQPLPVPRVAGTGWPFAPNSPAGTAPLLHWVEQRPTSPHVSLTWMCLLVCTRRRHAAPLSTIGVTSGVHHRARRSALPVLDLCALAGKTPESLKGGRTSDRLKGGRTSLLGGQMAKTGNGAHRDSTVLVGDAFDLINHIHDDGIDLVLTSPPYWGLRSYGLEHRDDVLAQWQQAGHDPEGPPAYDWYRDAGGVLGLEPYPQWYVAHLVEFFDRARSKLKQSGSLWVNLGDTYFSRWSSIRDEGRQGFNERRTRRRTPSGGYLRDKQLLLVPARFAIAMQEAGWILRNDLIWSKPNVMPRPESDRLRLSHEHWFHFVLRNPRGRPQ